MPCTRGLAGLYAPNAAQGWQYTAYFYTDPAHAHAVTSLSSGDTFAYDANGNMTTRVEGGVTYTQNFDIENRLASATVNSQTTTFVYDGDPLRFASGTSWEPRQEDQAGWNFYGLHWRRVRSGTERGRSNHEEECESIV